MDEPSNPSTVRPDRRSFLRAALAAGAGVALGAGSPSVAQTRPSPGKNVARLTALPMERVRIGMVGLGNRGSGLLRGLLQLDWVDVNAVCDTAAEKNARAAKTITDAGRRAPTAYVDWKSLAEADDIDLVYICTPWQWHVPMAVGAMEAGKHAFVEVPAALTVEDAWKLVDTAERTQLHCAMLENCCYGSAEMMVLNMVRQGVFGTLTHGEGAYIHDLRELQFDPKGYEGQWRLEFCKQFNGNHYPTHGLGPVAWYMDINRGDRFDYLVSMSSLQAGMSEYAADRFGKYSAEARQTYKLGDMNSSLIKTKLGRTILVQHDVTSPRPYTRLNTLSGTRATFAGYPDRLALAPDSHEWLSDEKYAATVEKYAHPLWKTVGDLAKKVGGHGGMDFVMNYRLFDCLRRGLPLDLSVYDAAAWSVVFPLSRMSLENRSASVDVPDFTRGAWQTTPPVAIEA